MTDSMKRARVIGALVLVVVFGAGVMLGAALTKKDEGGIRVTMTATDAMPKELESLNLTAAQKSQIQGALRRGRDRVLSVIDEFDPRMRAQADTTDQEIRAVLDSAQRAKFDSVRKAHPQFRTSHVIREAGRR